MFGSMGSLQFKQPNVLAWKGFILSVCLITKRTQIVLSFGCIISCCTGEKSRTRRRRKAGANEGLGAERKKRRLNDDQVKFLEMYFGNERKLESGRKMHLATELGLDPKQVAVWFQNRRARWKNKQQEEEYMKLKSEHDATVVQKCHLENEVLSLKKRLLEAEEKIKSLSRGGGGGGGDEGGSPSSSSTETYQPLAGLGEFGVGDELMYMNEYNYITEYGYGGLFGM